MDLWSSIAVSLILLGSVPVSGQRMGFSIGPTPVTPQPRGPGLTISFHAHPNQFPHRPHFFAPALYALPWLDSGFTYPEPISQPAPELQPILVLERAPERQQEVPQESKPELLLLERRGDQFVRVEHFRPERAGPADGMVRSKIQSAPGAVARGSTSPAVLIFRDGHRKEIESYTIADGILYAAADYWETGAWTESVQLSSLDLAATLRENHARGAKFMLPSGPNQVMVGP